MIECGIRFRAIREAFDFKLSRVDACLVTHSHGDHCKAARDIAKAGIDTWMSEKTQEEIGISGHRVRSFEPKTQFRIGTFNVLPFPLEHDVENHGFLLQSDEGGKVLYITDTYYCRFRFKGVTHYMVETNYSDDILEENIQRGVIHPSHRNRIKKSHFSLENVKAFFQANDLSQAREIHLIHISGQNGDPDRFVREIQEITGVATYA
jgi:phosphoribosyl 1,2-cyclic phosphodiesterase